MRVLQGCLYPVEPLINGRTNRALSIERSANPGTSRQLRERGNMSDMYKVADYLVKAMHPQTVAEFRRDRR